jgi:two-component system response regulator PilR (NtrC family)
MAALLIVDDDPIIRETFRRLFSDKYESDTADRAERALELLEVQEYDVIITDVSMPGGGGVQILKRIQTHALTIPIIVISASGDQFKDLFLEMGAFAYFSQPFRFEDIENAVKRAADRYPKSINPLA